MEDIFTYVIDQKEWVFSGIGVFVLGLFVYRRSKSKSKKMTQKLKNNSFGIQAGRDVQINK